MAEDGDVRASKVNKKKRRKIQSTTTTTPVVDEQTERFLENIVFGDSGQVLKNIDENIDLVVADVDQKINPKSDNIVNQFFVVDTVGEALPKTDVDLLVDQRRTQEAIEDISDDELRDLLREPKATKPEETQNAVWADEDDEILAADGFSGCKRLPKLVKEDDKYRDYLERKFKEVHEEPSWVNKAIEKKAGKTKKMQHSDDESSDDEMALVVERTARSSTKQFKKGKDGKIDGDFLHLKKCTRINQSSRVQTSIECLSFNPKATVALLGSRIGLVRVFQVDGKVNSMIQSIYFRGYHLTDAKFLSAAGREEIIVGSDGSSKNSIGYCYYYDMLAGKIMRVRLQKGCHNRFSLRKFEISPDGRWLAGCGENGRINLLTTTSKEPVAELKMNGDVECVAFSPDSNYLVSHGSDSGCQAFIWDIRNLRNTGQADCLNRFADIGTIEATALATSSTGRYLATGSNMGVVNLYSFADVCKKANPEPLKVVMNLTTRINRLQFNHDDQLLLMSSDELNDAIRFVNTDHLKVYKNFPLWVGANGKTYGRIYDVAFSPNSGYAAFATGNGSAHLFRLTDYSNY